MATLGRYSLIEPIGRGGMAEVWKAESEGIEGFRKTVAVKTLLPDLATDQQFLDLFVSEARIAAALHHANIVQVIDFGVARDAGPPVRDVYYIAMEYIRGRTAWQLLHRLRAEHQLLPPPLGGYIVAEAARALHYAHTRKRPVVHRDVSPQNILISDDGRVRVADFGIAKVVGAAPRTLPGTLRGKVSYLSPEQARLEELDPRTDIFAAGLLLFELLTGERFFKETQLSPAFLRRLRRFSGPSRAELNKAPNAFRDILTYALRGRREERYPSAQRLAKALQKACGARAFAEAERTLATTVTEHLAQPEPSTPSGGRMVTVLESYADPTPHNELARAVQDMWDVGDEPPTPMLPQTEVADGPTGSPGTPRTTATPETWPAQPDTTPTVIENEPTPIKPSAEPTTVIPARAAADEPTVVRPPPQTATDRVVRRSSRLIPVAATSATLLTLAALAAWWYQPHRTTPAAEPTTAPTRIARATPRASATPTATPVVETPTATPVSTPAATATPRTTARVRNPPTSHKRPRATPRRTPMRPTATPSPPRPDATRVAATTPTPTPTPAPTPAPGFGWLTINARPWVSVWIDGKRVAAFTPLRRHRISSGKHRVTLVNDDLGFKIEKALTIENERHMEIFVDTQTGIIRIN